MILPVQSQKQILTFWCWAAVTSSVSYYYNNNESGFQQAELAGNLLQDVCSTINQQNADSAPDDCNKPIDIVRSLSFSGNFGGQISRALTMDEIISQINAGYPICCQMLWDGFDNSHFVLLFGYEGNSLVIGDPDDDKIVHLPYTEFAFDYRSGGKWKRTIGTQSPNAQ